MDMNDLIKSLLTEACGVTPTDIEEYHSPIRRYTTYYCTCIEKMADDLTYKTVKEVEISAKVVGSSRKELVDE